MSWTNIGPSGQLIGITEPVAVTDEAAYLEVFVGQLGGIAYVVANSPLGGWTNWDETSSPAVGSNGPNGAAKLAVAGKWAQRVALFVAVDDEGSNGLTVWYMPQAKAGRSSDGNWPDPQSNHRRPVHRIARN